MLSQEKATSYPLQDHVADEAQPRRWAGFVRTDHAVERGAAELPHDAPCTRHARGGYATDASVHISSCI
jgi:hypothetical protein